MSGSVHVWMRNCGKYLPAEIFFFLLSACPADFLYDSTCSVPSETKQQNLFGIPHDILDTDKPTAKCHCEHGGNSGGSAMNELDWRSLGLILARILSFPLSTFIVFIHSSAE